MTDTEVEFEETGSEDEQDERPVEQEERALLPQAYDMLSEFVSYPPDQRLERMLEMGEEGRTELALAVGRGYRVSKALMGQLAHAERLACGPGEWTRRARVLAMAMGVSGQTVQRNLLQYLRQNDLELPDDQTQWGGARERSGPLEADRLQESWTDGYTYTADGDPVENAARFREAVGEPWAEPDTSAGPSTRYENADGTSAGPRPLDEPPADWLEATVTEIMEEYPAFDRVGAERNAKSRWQKISRDSAVRDEALEALDQDTLIELMAELQDEDGGLELADVRQMAENAWVEAYKKRGGSAKSEPGGDVQVVKKKSSSQGKGKVGGDGFKNVENGMIYAREVHEHMVKVVAEGGDDALWAAYEKAEGNLSSWKYVVEGMLTKLRRSKEALRAAGKQTHAGPPTSAYASERPIHDVPATTEF